MTWLSFASGAAVGYFAGCGWMLLRSKKSVFSEDDLLALIDKNADRINLVLAMNKHPNGFERRS